MHTGPGPCSYVANLVPRSDPGRPVRRPRPAPPRGIRANQPAPGHVDRRRPQPSGSVIIVMYTLRLSSITLPSPLRIWRAARSRSTRRFAWPPAVCGVTVALWGRRFHRHVTAAAKNPNFGGVGRIGLPLSGSKDKLLAPCPVCALAPGARDSATAGRESTVACRRRLRIGLGEAMSTRSSSCLQLDRAASRVLGPHWQPQPTPGALGLARVASSI